MDLNPLFDADGSDGDSSSHTSLDGLSYTGAAISAVSPPPVAVLQTVNIKSHVPVVLELANPNYDEWRCFFDASRCARRAKSSTCCAGSVPSTATRSQRSPRANHRTPSFRRDPTFSWRNSTTRSTPRPLPSTPCSSLAAPGHLLLPTVDPAVLGRHRQSPADRPLATTPRAAVGAGVAAVVTVATTSNTKVATPPLPVVRRLGH